MKIIKTLRALTILLASMSLLTGCGQRIEEESRPAAPVITEGTKTLTEEKVAEGYVISQEETNYIDFLMDSGNHIVIELNPDSAPLTVANFKALVGQSFYDGLIFHRIIEGFMIQGGDPEGTGRGGSRETIKGEFLSNGVDNRLSHRRGAVSMARTPLPNSASSQFFICHGDSLFLDGDYAAFGRVILGMEEVDRLALLETGAGDFPLTPPVMERVFFVSPTA